MTFTELIVKYYLPHQQRELIQILNDLFEFKELESSFDYLMQAASSNNKNEVISQFVLTIRDFVTIFYKTTHETIPGEQQSWIYQKLEEFSIYLIKEIYNQLGLAYNEFIELLFQTVRKTYISHSWKISNLDNVFNIEKFKTITLNEKGSFQQNIHNHSGPIKLDWQGQEKLDLFIHDLTQTFQGVKSKKKVYLLFDPKTVDFKIELPSRHLLPFLSLFYDLHVAKTIRVIGNRGLFIYLNQHLQPPPNDSYPKRDFRKLRHEAEQNKIIKNNISLVTRPLLNKYCCNGQLDNRRTLVN